MNNNKQHTALRALIEGAIMIALATALGYLRLYRMPAGGSVDFALVPILIYCLRWGPKYSFGCSFVNGVLQFFLGGGFAITWQSMLLDYVAAYTLVGFAGFAAGKKLSWVWAAIIGNLGRFVSIYLAGVFIWGVYMPESFLNMTMTTPWFYSFLYNGILTLLVLAVDLVVMGLMQTVPYVRKNIMAYQLAEKAAPMAE